MYIDKKSCRVSIKVRERRPRLLFQLFLKVGRWPLVLFSGGLLPLSLCFVLLLSLIFNFQESIQKSLINVRGNLFRVWNVKGGLYTKH